MSFLNFKIITANTVIPQKLARDSLLSEFKFRELKTIPTSIRIKQTK